MNEQTYTATEIATFIAAIGVLITGIGAVVVNIIVALKQGKKTDEIITAVAKVDAETKVIAGHVNSAATASTSKIAALENKIEMMTKTASDIKEALLLNTMPPPPKTVESVPSELVLDKIESNTKSIDNNTKKAKKIT